MPMLASADPTQVHNSRSKDPSIWLHVNSLQPAIMFHKNPAGNACSLTSTIATQHGNVPTPFLSKIVTSQAKRALIAESVRHQRCDP